MTSAAVIKQPPSPPQSNDGDFDLSAVQQHVASLDRYQPPRSIRPAMTVTAEDQYGDPSKYQTAPAPSYYPTAQTVSGPSFPGQGGSTDAPIQTFHQVPQPDTPPTSLDRIRTRSGRTIGSPLTPDEPKLSRRSRSPRPKKATRAAKVAKTRGPVIAEPLSVLTRDYTTPVRDMEAWVNRSVDIRMQEVQRKNGYVARPMNSFMMYRSAYAERVKQYCKENNHQVVSQVSGSSWPLEPKEIRSHYEKLASLERDNHQAAHPDYKFAPNKNGSSKKRKDLDDDASDMSDPDWEDSRRGGTKRSRLGRHDTSRSRTSTPFETPRAIQHPMAHTWHPSSYQAANPDGQAPMVLGSDDYGSHYYQTTITPYGQYAEDVSVRRLENPFPHHNLPTPLIGLPNGDHQDLLQPHHRAPTSMTMQHDPLDPRLLQQYDESLQYEPYEAVDPRYEAVSGYDYSMQYTAPLTYGYPTPASYHPGMVTLTDGRDRWAQEEQVGSDFDEEFGKWSA